MGFGSSQWIRVQSVDSGPDEPPPTPIRTASPVNGTIRCGCRGRRGRAGAGGALCPADFTSGGGGPDGLVGINDFLGVLAQWGNVCPCPADITGPEDSPPGGMVGILDFLKILADWGPCP